MYDRIESLHGATIQHGAYNRRVYLMSLGTADPDALVPALAELADASGYGKVFAKVPRSAAAAFLKAGYRKEAEIDGFFGGGEAAVFLGFYRDEARRREPDPEALEQTLELARSKAKEPGPPSPLPPGFRLVPCGQASIPAMSRIYGQVFPSYPFPIAEPEYLAETMQTHVDYFAAEDQSGNIRALSSAEMDPAGTSVEMTDFATVEAARGQGLATHLLKAMETAMTARGVATAYTIARALSPGMNITFARCGYRYAGTLTNNTNIGGRIESMNVWFKPLQPPPPTAAAGLGQSLP